MTNGIVVDENMRHMQGAEHEAKVKWARKWRIRGAGRQGRAITLNIITTRTRRTMEKIRKRRENKEMTGVPVTKIESAA